MLFFAFETLVFIIMVGESLGCERKTPPNQLGSHHKNKNKDNRGKREVNFFTNNISFVGSVLFSTFQGIDIPKFAYVFIGW